MSQEKRQSMVRTRATLVTAQGGTRAVTVLVLLLLVGSVTSGGLRAEAVARVGLTQAQVLQVCATRPCAGLGMVACKRQAGMSPPTLQPGAGRSQRRIMDRSLPAPRAPDADREKRRPGRLAAC